MTTRSTIANQRGINRIQSQLERSFAAGNLYEAHQLYRTLYFRFIALKKYKECADVLYDGSIKLIANSQECSGADLGLLTIDTLEKCEDLDLEDWWDRLSFLIECLSPNVVERESIINRAIKWSSDVTAKKFGVPVLHRRIGCLLWREQNIEQARHHLLLSQNGYLFGKFLLRMNEKCYINEMDLLITQAILQLLSLKDHITAEGTFSTYVQLHPKIRRHCAPFDLPLLNFTFYLIQCVEKNLPETFPVLCNLYKPSLDRDEAFHKYLHKIGVLYFNTSLNNVNNSEDMSGNNASDGNHNSGENTDFMGGMFGDLFSRLFQGFGEVRDNGSGNSGGEDAGTDGDVESSDIEFEDAVESDIFSELD